MAFSVGQITATIGANTRPFKDAVSDVQRRGKNLATQLAPQMQQVGRSMTMGLTLPLAAAGGALIKMASDAEETRQKFEVVFGSISKEAESAANNLQKSFGLSSKSARQLLGDTGDILTGFGFTEESALDLSEKVNKLAVDLASFTNFAGGAEGASQALTKAMLGEAESAKALGIVIRQDTDEYKDLIEQIMKTNNVGLVQAKALAALQIATEQSKNAIGDFERTQDSFANQMRQLTAEVSDLAVSLGNELLPFANKVLSKVRYLVNGFSGLSAGFKKTGLAIMGVAAASGPTIWALGTLITNFKTLKTVMLANPYVAVGIAVAGLATHLAMAYGNAKKLKEELQNVITGQKTITEIEKMNSLIAEQEELMKKTANNFRGRTASAVDAHKKRMEDLNSELQILIDKRNQIALTDLDNIISEKTPAIVEEVNQEVNELVKSIARVRVAASAPVDAIIDPADITNTRILREEFQAFNNALYFASTFTMDFSHRMSHVAEQSNKAANAMSITKAIGDNFANSFGQGMSNIVVQGERVIDVLENIGKLLLSAAIQKGLSILLSGGLAGDGYFGSKGGLIGGAVRGIGKVFGADVSAAPVASSGEMAMTRAFKSAMDQKMNELTPEAVWIMGEKGRLGI